MSAEKCPICDGPPGSYRYGACSVGCDQVMGTPTSIVGLVGGLLFALAVLGVLFLAVRG